MADAEPPVEPLGLQPHDVGPVSLVLAIGPALQGQVERLHRDELVIERLEALAPVPLDLLSVRVQVGDDDVHGPELDDARHDVAMAPVALVRPVQLDLAWQQQRPQLLANAVAVRLVDERRADQVLLPLIAPARR